MAEARGVGAAGGIAKGLFQSAGETGLWINGGAVAGTGAFAGGGGRSAKRHKDFGGGGSGGISGSELLFEVVSETDWAGPHQVA